MGRKSRLQKADDIKGMSTEFQEVNITPSTFALAPNVDYDSVVAQISNLEDLAKQHPMSETVTRTTTPPMKLPLTQWKTQVTSSHQDFSIATALHNPINAATTGREAIGPRIAPVLTEIQQKKIQFLSEPLKREPEDPTLPPVHDDFLSFLMEKQPLSFGWVVDNEFLTNFDIRPDLFDSSDKFIFWIVPANINIFKVSSAGGFQKSESRSLQLQPHIFLIKILEIPEGHEEEDPFTAIINDDRYIKLRESVEKRGIAFVYDHNPSRIWLSVLCGRLKIR